MKSYKHFFHRNNINADEAQRLDFIERERDFENGYMALGARNYDPKLGRFLSCDPLMESFPAQSPYNYAYNSPMQWKDPSGLAPEKEEKKGKAKVQWADIPTKEFVDMSFIQKAEFEEQQRFARMKQIAKDIFEGNVAATRGYGMPARLGSGGDRANTGEGTAQSSELGKKKSGGSWWDGILDFLGLGSKKIPFTDDMKDQVRNNTSFTKNGAQDMPISQEIQNNYFNSVFEGYGSEIDKDQWEHLKSTQTVVDVNDETGWSDYLCTQDNKNGMAYSSETQNVLHFQESMLDDNSTFLYGTYSVGYREFSYDRTSVIMHEVGHSYGKWVSARNGIDYQSLTPDQKENYGIRGSNIYFKHTPYPYVFEK